jgi:hypothetical protein
MIIFSYYFCDLKETPIENTELVQLVGAETGINQLKRLDARGSWVKPL